MNWLLIFFIRFYQIAISPYFSACCRFQPTCSEYAIIAIRRFDAIKGSWLAFKRLLRCRPKQIFGFDPVPESILRK